MPHPWLPTGTSAQEGLGQGNSLDSPHRNRPGPSSYHIPTCTHIHAHGPCELQTGATEQVSCMTLGPHVSPFPPRGPLPTERHLWG